MAPGPVGGVAAADYDRDGDIDLFVPNGGGAADQLYRNLGNGSFEEIAATVGLASVENNRAALWFDYDGDHRPDLVVGGDCMLEPQISSDPCPNPANLRLYRQLEDGQFSDVTVAAGLDAGWGGTQDVHRAGLAAGDINGDGFLDLFVCDWGKRPYLYLNNGNGAFDDITAAAGISLSALKYQQPILYDADGDGLLDIFASIDVGFPNRLWINQGDNTFVEVAASAGVNHSGTDMGIALGDYDNDGDFDLFVTNITVMPGGNGNVFYRNDSIGLNLSFTEIAASLGVGDTGWGWGTTFLDADNDGHLDLAATNGRTGSFETDQSQFYLSDGGDPVDYINVSSAVGFDDTLIAVCLIAIDFDRDGDLDMVQTINYGGPLRLLENTPGAGASANHYLVIRPRMHGTNHYAIGAVVESTVGSTARLRPITAGISQVGQEPAEAFFGLGFATRVDSVRIRWPDGAETILTDVASDQALTIFPCPADVNADLSLDAADVVAFVRCLIGEDLIGDECFVADLDGNGQTNAQDLDAFLDLYLGGVVCPPAS
jgi:hypothetical protein